MIANVVVTTLLARWSDRLPSRRLVLLIGSGAGAVGYAGYAVVRDPWLLWLIGVAILSLASLTFSQLFAHARECVDRSEAPPAEAPLYLNAFRMIYAAAWGLGPPLAAMALAKLGFAGLFLAASVFYALFAALITGCVPARATEAKARALPPALLSTLWTQPNLLSWFAAFVMIFAAQAIAMSNMSLYVLDELGGTEAQVGTIFSLAPVFEVPAMLYLGLVAARVEPGRLIRSSMLLATVYYGAICLARAPWHIYPLQVLSAIIVAISSGVAITFFQDKMPGQFGSATNLYVNSIRIGSVSGYLILGPVASQFGHRGAFVACALLSLVALVGTRVLIREADGLATTRG